MKSIRVFQAADGKTFPNAAACLDHEDKSAIAVLLGTKVDPINRRDVVNIIFNNYDFISSVVRRQKARAKRIKA